MLVIRLVYCRSLARNECHGCQRLGLLRATTLSFEEGVIAGWEGGGGGGGWGGGGGGVVGDWGLWVI